MDGVCFDKSAAVSTLIKSMRFGDYEEASYWFTVLLENDIDELYLAKRFSIFAAEDCFDSGLIILANSIYQMYAIKAGDNNMLWQLLYRCCTAQKFWQTKEGQEYELKANKAIHRYKSIGIVNTPKWAIDKHTKIYYSLLKENKEVETDLRFSGDETGRLHMILMYQKYGRISPDIDDPQLYENAKALSGEYK